MIFDHTLFNRITLCNCIGIFLGFLNAVLPMEDINEWMFPIHSEKMELDYYDAEK
jgi:hypothetical protein